MMNLSILIRIQQNSHFRTNQYVKRNVLMQFGHLMYQFDVLRGNDHFKNL